MPPKALTTTTPTPYIYTTAKPRRKQHQSHNHKGTHDTSGPVKEILIPNVQENEILGPAAGGSLEGMFHLHRHVFTITYGFNGREIEIRTHSQELVFKFILLIVASSVA